MSRPGDVFFVGPGRIGLALGYALAHTEQVGEITVCGRRPEPPAHPLFTQRMARYVFGLERPRPGTEAVFLALPPDAIPEMAHALAGQGDAPEGCAAFHLSPALPTEALAPLHERGYGLGAFHPLQTVGHPVVTAERLMGSYVAVTGSPMAVAVARRLAAALGSPVLTVPETWRPRFHAATALAASCLPPLLDAACRILERAGVPHGEALPALMPLVRGTLADIEESGLVVRSGPIASGDVETVDLHLRALDPEDRRLYALLGLEIARIAESDGGDEGLAAVVNRLTEVVEG